MVVLKSKIHTEGGIYKRYSSALEKLGINKFEDFLYYAPFRYDDYSIVSDISKVQAGEVVTIRGEIVEIKNQYLRKMRTIQKATLKDGTGEIEIVWFNQPFLTKSINKGDRISLSGKILQNNNRLTMQSPDYELETGEFIHTGRLVPIYSETKGISSKWIRRQVYKILTENKSIEDFLPQLLLKDEDLLDLNQAIAKVHFPANLEEAQKARERLAFNELLLIQAGSSLLRQQWSEQTKGFNMEIEKNREKINNFIKSLPFTLTSAQDRAVTEMFLDLSRESPMNRLLEGDVGSGKTVVAAILMYLVFLNGYKSVLMAPTAILTNQHYDSIKSFFEPLGLKIALATGSRKISIDNFDILIGTHAVLSDKIKADKIGLVIIDEQQRFGVEQRGIFRKKGQNPHLLTMTATPIPRTVALTAYGNLDLSVLDELPMGRKKIKTWLVPKAKRADAYQWIKQQIKEHKTQVFIVCPFIEESESMVSVKAAKKEFEDLSRNVFKDLRLGLLHGKQKAKEKDEILSEFRKGRIDILVATPVVEVGIDIPNAGIIVIEAADRFGLAQLHQLRGRVGRGGQEAYCLLFSESTTATPRLKYMETTQIGAKLAELDLQLRGPGEIFGVSQHGNRLLKIASFSDFEMIKKTKKVAQTLLKYAEKYPDFIKKVSEQHLENISPD